MSSSSDSLRARAYRRDIDGLRSLAILSVVLFHAGLRPLSGGFTGVDIFFAISGYLIGGHINSELTHGSFSFARFYRNRAKRILPALYAVLIAVLAIGLLLLSPRELRDLAMYAFSTTASASNIMLWRTVGYFAPTADQNPLLMTWSLGVEEQFYLVVPVLLVLVAKLRHRLSFLVVILISAVSFGVALYQVRHSPDPAFYLLTSRAWELGIGVALAIFEVEGRRLPALQTRLANEVQAWAGLVLMVAPFFLLNSRMPFPGVAALPSVAGAALLLSSSGAWVNERLLSWSPLVFIGRVSYSFYLVHWPVLAYLHVLRGDALPVAWALLGTAIAFGLAVLSYYFVERPFRSSKRAAGPLLVRYAAVSLLLLAVSGAIYRSNGLRWRYPQAAALDDIAANVIRMHPDACLIEEGHALMNQAPACTGVNVPGAHIALWGDSHASAVAASLRARAERQGYFMEEYAKTSCPPLYGVGRTYRLHPSSLVECIRFNDAVLKRLTGDPQVKIVVLDAYWDGAFDPHYTDEGKLATAGHAATDPPTQGQSEALLKSALTNTLRALLTAGKQVVVVGDSPVFDVNPIWRMRTRDIPLRWKLSRILNGDTDVDPGAEPAFDDTPPQQAGERLLQEVASSLPGVTFWDTREQLCDSRSLCVYRKDRMPLYVDTNHLSPAGALRVSNEWTLPLSAPAGGTVAEARDPAP